MNEFINRVGNFSAISANQEEGITDIQLRKISENLFVIMTFYAKIAEGH